MSEIPSPHVEPRASALIAEDMEAFGHGYAFWDGHEWRRLDPRLLRLYRRPGAPYGPETHASPEPLPGPPEALRGLRAGRVAPPGAAEGRGEPPAMPSSGGGPGADGGPTGALLSAVANMMLEFDGLEGDGMHVGIKMMRAWPRHRQRLFDALSGGDDLGLEQMKLGERGAAKMELVLALAIGFLLLAAVKAWLT